MNTKYYGIEYYSTPDTTWNNEKHPLSGYFSIACDIEVFRSKRERDTWVDNGKVTSDMQGNCRRKANKGQARHHKLGISIADFQHQLDANEFMRYEV